MTCKFPLFIAFLFCTSSLWAQPLKSEKALECIKSEESFYSLKSKLEQKDILLSKEEVEPARKLLWELFQKEQALDSVRLQSHENRVLEEGERQMKYYFETIGEKPAEGYPLYIALHGGGGTRAEVNDMQWEHMKVFYKNSIDKGIYLAPRGISNTWNLHFMEESYPLYRRLIQNMILYEGVDPNRIFILGYSAGGDGVYQIAPRLSDLLAGANMSAGHHNGVSPVNLFKVPFLMQVGELDAAYKRNVATVQYAQRIRKLQQESPDGYLHQVFVHWECGHGHVRDHFGSEDKASIIKNPEEWIQDPESREQASANCDAIAWLNGYQRESRPQHLIWDRNTFDKGGPLTYYWLEGISEGNMTGTVNVKLDSDKNAVVFEEKDAPLAVWLDDSMLDLDQPVIVKLPERELSIFPERSLRRMVSSLELRGDPAYIFPMRISLK